MKSEFKVPAVLSISLLLILGQTAGAFFAKSLALFSYGGLILTAAFSSLPVILNAQSFDRKTKGFYLSHYSSILLNCSVLFIVALVIIYKAYLNTARSLQINTALACWVAFSAFAGLSVCCILLWQKTKEDKRYKPVLIKYALTAAASFFVIIGTAVQYLKDIYIIDSAISITFAVFMTTQVMQLMKTAFKTLRGK